MPRSRIITTPRYRTTKRWSPRPGSRAASRSPVAPGCPTGSACYRPPLLGPRARGGIGRRAGFRFQYRKMWGFESLRAHHFRAQAVRGTAEHGNRRSSDWRRPEPDLHQDLSNVTIKTVETENQGLKRAFMLT